MRLTTLGALALTLILAMATLPLPARLMRWSKAEDRVILPNTLPVDEEPAAVLQRNRVHRDLLAMHPSLAPTRLARAELPASAASR